MSNAFNVSLFNIHYNYSQKEKDQIDTLSFIRTFLYNNFILKEATIDSFKQKFLSCFSDIVLYSNEDSEKLNKIINRKIYPKKDKLQKELNFFDENNNGFISFVVLKKIIDNVKLNISNEQLEYLIYLMKKDETCVGLKQLNYYNLINILTPLNEDENCNAEDDSIIEITNEEYLKKANDIMQKIAGELSKKQKSFDDIFFKYSSNKNNQQEIELSKVVDVLKQDFEMSLTPIEVFCLFSKVKLEEINDNNNNPNNNLNNTNTGTNSEGEIIDYQKFKNEIILCQQQQLNKELVLQSGVINENYYGTSKVEDININLPDNQIIIKLQKINFERAIFPFHCKMKLITKDKSKYERLMDLNLFKDFLKKNSINYDNNCLISLLVNNESIYVDGKINIDSLKKLCEINEEIIKENKNNSKDLEL